MKKLINDPDAVTREALEGMELAHGDRLRVSYEPAFVVRADAPVQGKVGIVSGGGSGHEPMHGGFVGPGMLDAACPGEVFTSPTPDQMLEATKAVDGGAGVLHIVKNYTGDVLNFEMAADLAGGEGIEVAAVVINDDVAVEDSPLHRRAPRRRRDGAGGEDLRRRRRGRPAARRGGRAVPARQRRVAQHGHGAHGLHHAVLRRALLRPARRRDGDRDRHPRRAGPLPRAAGAPPSTSWSGWPPRWPTTCRSPSGDRVLAFVNGMGGTPLIELYIVYRELQRFLRGAASASPATSSATTSPRSRWPAARSRCCAWTTS